MRLLRTGLRCFRCRGSVVAYRSCSIMKLSDHFNGYRLRLMAMDAVIIALTFYAAFSLRTDQYPLGAQWTKAYAILVGVVIAYRLLAFSVLGVYRIAVRYTGTRDVLVIAAAVAASMAFIIATIAVVRRPMIPLSVCVISGLLDFVALGGVRAAYRVYMERQPFTGSASKRRRILIIGAGRRGAALAREIHARSHEGLVLVGFLDDDPVKRHQLIQGVPVLGTTHEAAKVVADHHVDEIIIAISTARGQQIQQITKRCAEVPARLRISPGFAVLDEHNLFANLRDVRVEDLLQREPVKVDMEEIAAYLRGQVVLITGAGGSIGGELARQIAAVGPAHMVLLGHGENSIFEIAEELKRGPHVPASTVIADVRDYDRLLKVFRTYKPNVVFHAAAHKHVPLMELNPEEAITNNVLGTRNLARVAKLTGVRRFVLISTDKAVNPTSIMGASKRVAERVIQREAMDGPTEFATVRFGNVLGSRGSVVPVMRNQIEHGGPVTVTHPEVTRYFMTIPEAVQLVIQAGALGGNGTVYVLDMGEPVKILDLAYSLIRLSGLVPEKDIKIEITGLRPGEKLKEELLTDVEATTVTRHSRIFQADLSPAPVDDLDTHVDALIQAAQAGDVAEVLRWLRLLVPRFTCDRRLATIAELHSDGSSSEPVGQSEEDREVVVTDT